MGSSMVTMCARRVRLMWPMTAAIVVVLPVPVGPVSRTSPRLESDRSFITGGRSSSSNVGTSARTRRTARPTFPRWRNAFTRNRPTPGSVKPKSASFVAANSRILWSGISCAANVWLSIGVSDSKLVGRSEPSTRMNGTLPALR